MTSYSYLTFTFLTPRNAGSPSQLAVGIGGDGEANCGRRNGGVESHGRAPADGIADGVYIMTKRVIVNLKNDRSGNSFTPADSGYRFVPAVIE